LNQAAFFLLLIFLLSCNSYAPQQRLASNASIPLQKTSSNAEKEGGLRGDTTLNISGHLVEIRLPKANNALKNLLVLPGWNFSRNDWCKNSRLCSLALAKGYVLLLPEMGKSIYAWQTYPETRADWLSYPTGKWVIEEMIPYLQNQTRLLLPGQKNFLIGLSTGARGVALLAQWQNSLWLAGAALSGDYEPLLLQQDNLLIGFYGPYEKFPERWKGKDNPTQNIRLLQTPLYIGHGKKDKIVPAQQSEVFFQAIQKNNPNLAAKCAFFLRDASHDYKYWDSELDSIFAFFESF
jgi:S-formylglutathione hydrolase FrmB